MGQLKIAVIGAGVIGCTTAIELQSEFPNAEITIIANKFNEETLSDGAAGIFRPGTSFLVENEDITRKIIEESYKYYNDIYENIEPRQAGVSQVSGYIYSNSGRAQTENSLIDKIVPVYRYASEEELTLCPGQWKYGAFFTTLLTECRYYLPWSLGRFKHNGGVVKKESILKLTDIADTYDVAVCCLGLGAQQVCQDRHLVPMRGQVIKVKAPWLKKFVYAHLDAYIIPGLEYVTLGGCRNYDSYDLNVSRHDSAGIWERCTSLVPRLKEATVVKEWVGLRPHRHSVRVEMETLPSISGKPFKVVHNYGHGGYGVTSAPGCAKYAVNLVRRQLLGNSKI